ncbi:MAG: hypothetical protein P4K83_01050 [Terracidiphilus sp.]|nr:hypothetical protein [Terracidiphilus sp.]
MEIRERIPSDGGQYYITAQAPAYIQQKSRQCPVCASPQEDGNQDHLDDQPNSEPHLDYIHTNPAQETSAN